MPEQQETTSSTKQTEGVAARFARSILAGTSLRVPLVILLKGDLGAGKTTFVRGFVRALPGGEHVVVQSPTFALSRRYPTTPPVQHLDLYRLHDEPGAEEAMRDLGLDDDDAAGIVFVEWPVRSEWSVPVVSVEIQILSPRRRRVQISWS